MSSDGATPREQVSAVYNGITWPIRFENVTDESDFLAALDHAVKALERLSLKAEIANTNTLAADAEKQARKYRDISQKLADL